MIYKKYNMHFNWKMRPLHAIAKSPNHSTHSPWLIRSLLSAHMPMRLSVNVFYSVSSIWWSDLGIYEMYFSCSQFEQWLCVIKRNMEHRFIGFAVCFAHCSWLCTNHSEQFIFCQFRYDRLIARIPKYRRGANSFRF